jgi:glycine cleavage system transcriptional repressor
MPQLILTAVGPDRPGIVGELTGAIHSAGGNILDSRMVNLRGEFAILILLEASDTDSEKMRADLPRLADSMSLRLSVSLQSTSRPRTEGLPYKLKTYSLDQPGIVARLTKILRDHQVNIEDLSARQESAAFAGSPLFLTELRLTIPKTVKLTQLRRDLETFANDLNCDVDLDPADS